MNDPKKIGPGFWSSWHIRTLNYTSKNDQNINKLIIERDIKQFPCMECRGHALEYLVNHPFPKNQSTYSLFKWTVDFHNTVNLRLGKDAIDFEDAKKMWSGENVCLEDCGEEESVEINVEEMEQNHPNYFYKIY